MSHPRQSQSELLRQQHLVEICPSAHVREDRLSRAWRDMCWIVLGFLITAGCDAGPSSSDMDALSLPPFEDSVLEDYMVAVNPDPSTLLPLINMELAPVVMVNLLHFHDEAQGNDFEGLSGREVYEQYIAAIADLQQDIGSRVIWDGGVDAQVVGISDPVFDVALLLEYQNIEAFLGFSTDSSSEDSSEDDDSSDEEDSSEDEDDADSSSASGFARYSAILASNSLLWRLSCSFMRFKARPFALLIFFCPSLSLRATSRQSSSSASVRM